MVGLYLLRSTLGDPSADTDSRELNTVKEVYGQDFQGMRMDKGESHAGGGREAKGWLVAGEVWEGRNEGWW